MVRDLNLHDLVILEQEAKFQLPKLESPLFIVKKSVEIDGKLIGSFFVKLTSEVSLIFDSSISKLTRARALREIFIHLYLELNKRGFNDTHIFLKDDLKSYGELLKKHCGFEDVIGSALVLRKKDG